MRIERVGEILERARGKRILVAGDLILDEFLWGEVTRISPEAPVPVVRVTGESWYPGGAANVARNVHELGARTGVLGACGTDSGGSRLIASLQECGIDTAGCACDGRHSTIVKTRVVAKHQQVVRVDREPGSPSDWGSSLTNAAAEQFVSEADAVIFSDYAKGFLSQRLVDAVLAAATTLGKTVTVDPSPLNPLRWTGATAIKPNKVEALEAAGFHRLSPTSEDLVGVGNQLLAKWETRLILLTLGEEGMLLFERDKPVFHTPTRAREVFDVSGAGDTAIAAFTLALLGGADPAEAADIANTAAGIVVGKLGTATVTADEVLAAYQDGA